MGRSLTMVTSVEGFPSGYHSPCTTRQRLLPIRRVPVLGVLTMMFLTGCVTTTPPRSPQASQAIPSATPAPIPAKNALPSEQQVQLSWTAAEELRKRGFEREALEQYDKVRDLAPDYPNLAWRLALLTERLGDFTRARKEYHRAFMADPSNVELLADRGYFHYHQKELEEAERWLRQALQVKPDHARAWTNLALTLGQRGKYTDSFNCFLHVVPRAQAHVNMGVMLVRQNRLTEARDQLQQALEQDSQLSKARQLLKWIEEESNSPNAQPERINLSGLN